MHLTQWKKYEDAENYIMRTFIPGTFCPVLLRQCFTNCLPGTNP